MSRRPADAGDAPGTHARITADGIDASVEVEHLAEEVGDLAEHLVTGSSR